MNRKRATVLLAVSVAVAALLGFLATRGSPEPKRSVAAPSEQDEFEAEGPSRTTLGSGAALVERSAGDGATAEQERVEAPTGDADRREASRSSTRAEESSAAPSAPTRPRYSIVIEGEVRSRRWRRVPRATVTYIIPIERGGKPTTEHTTATGTTNATGRFEITAPLRGANESPGSPVVILIDSRNHAVRQQIARVSWPDARQEQDGRWVHRVRADLYVEPVAAFVSGSCPAADEVFLTTAPGPDVPYPARVLDRGPGASFRLRAPASGCFAVVAVARERHPVFALVDVEAASDSRGSPPRIQIREELAPIETRLDVSTAGPRGFDPVGLHVRVVAADLQGRPREESDGPGGWLGEPPFFAWNASPSAAPTAEPWGWDLCSEEPGFIGDLAVTEFQALGSFGSDGLARLLGAPSGSIDLWIESPFWRGTFAKTFVGTVVALDRVVAQPPVARLDLVPVGSGVPRVARGTGRAICPAPPDSTPLVRSARLDEKGVATLYVPDESRMRIEMELDASPAGEDGEPGAAPPVGFIDSFRSPRAGAAHSLSVEVQRAEPDPNQ